jgi:hypothetical protein
MAPVIVVFGPKTFSGHGALPQYRSQYLQQIRFADYRAICLAVIAGDVKAAAAAGKRNVRRVREIVRGSR